MAGGSGQVDIDVLVVGAGPVGLTAALELRRRRVGCRVVDKLTEPPQYAKAVGVQPRTLELWEAAGVLPAVLDAALPIRGQFVYREGEQVAAMDLVLRTMLCAPRARRTAGSSTCSSASRCRVADGTGCRFWCHRSCRRQPR